MMYKPIYILILNIFITLTIQTLTSDNSLQLDISDQFKDSKFKNLVEISPDDDQQKMQQQLQKQQNSGEVVKNKLNEKIQQYYKKKDNLQKILSDESLSDDQKIQIQEKKDLAPQIEKINKFETNQQQDKYEQIIQDISNNNFMSQASEEDNVKELGAKQEKINYYDEIEENVQNKMSQIQKESDMEIQNQKQKQEQLQYKNDYKGQSQKKFLQTKKGQELSTQLQNEERRDRSMNQPNYQNYIQNNDHQEDNSFQQQINDDIQSISKQQSNNQNKIEDNKNAGINKYKYYTKTPRFFELDSLDKLQKQFEKNSFDVVKISRKLQDNRSDKQDLVDNYQKETISKMSNQNQMNSQMNPFISNQMNDQFYNPTHLNEINLNMM